MFVLKDPVDAAVLFSLLGGGRRPVAGDDVVGRVIVLQADEVEWNGGELSGAAALQEQNLVVARYVPAAKEEIHLPAVCNC